MQAEAASPTGPDLTRIETIFVCQGDAPHANRISDLGNQAASLAAIERGECPDCGARIGASPVAINGNVVEFQDAAALRAGESAVIAKYHKPASEVSTLAEAEQSDAVAAGSTHHPASGGGAS
jgi:hypothetical protein